MLQALKTLTFIYVPREDRVLAAINAGHADPWFCWLTRRLALAVLDRTTEYLANTSVVARRAPAQLRGELIAFDHDAGIANTAHAMSITPPEVLKASETAAELAERLTISPQGDGYRLELHGQTGAGAAAAIKRAELQRILQMLQIEVTKAGWLVAPAEPKSGPTAAGADPKKPIHH